MRGGELRARLTTLGRALRRRFNPRLHPLLAVGIGIGVVALVLPGPAPRGEAHSDEEILARLVAPELDLEHGPTFWLGELARGSALAARAEEVCAEGLHPLQPNCRMLPLLVELRARAEASTLLEPARISGSPSPTAPSADNPAAPRGDD